MSNLNEKTGVVEIGSIQTTLNTPTLPVDFDVKKWLAGQVLPKAILLAHTFSGIIWGYRDDNGWHLSSDVASTVSPKLETHLLIKMRIFNANEEIFLWRDEAQFRCRQLVDGQGEARDYYDEPYILWGTQGTALSDGFTLLEDGTQGLAHAIPVAREDFDLQNVRPASVQVRHYIERDGQTGLARVTRSRLVKLEVGHGS